MKLNGATPNSDFCCLGLSFAEAIIATDIQILNTSLRPPAISASLVPQIEEVTADIIRNDTGTSDMLAKTSSSEDTETASEDDDSPSVDSRPLGWVLDNWMILAVVSGIAVAFGALVRLVASFGTANSNGR